METFTKITNPSKLIPILESRMPRSCYLINQMKSYSKFTNEMQLFAYEPSSNINDTWIMTSFLREDWGLLVCVSGPPDKEAPPKVREIFLKSGVIDWSTPLLLSALEQPVFEMMMSIQMEVGNVVTVYPNILLHMTKEKALQLEIKCNDNMEMKPLEPESGTEFIADNWKHKSDKTHLFVRKNIERVVSCGVYVKSKSGDENELVCGAIGQGFGVVGMLHTDPKHRRKGYASLCMKYLLRELAKEGFEPTCNVENYNQSSLKLQRSAGLEDVCNIYFISSNKN